MTRLALVVAPFVVSVALAAPAGAVEYCVHKGTGCAPGAIDEGDDLQAAIDSADVTDEQDTIVVGPGTYEGPFLPTAGTRLEIIGAGVGETVLVSDQTGYVIKTDGADVSDLTVRVPSIGFFTGIVANHTSTLTNVEVVGDPPTAESRVGVSLYGGSNLHDSTVTLSTANDYAVIGDNPSGTPRVKRSTISGFYGFYVYGPEDRDAILSRTTIDARVPVMALGTGIVADNLVVHGTGASAMLIVCDTFNDRGARFVGDHLTILGHGSPAGVRVECDDAGSAATATISNSAIDGFTAPFVRDGSAGAPANIGFSYSNLAAADGESSGPGVAVLTNMLDVPPAFAPDGVRLSAASPLRDAGAPGQPEQELDRDGLPRLIGERQDIGAFEFDPSAGAGTGGDAPGGGRPAPTGDAVPAGLVPIAIPTRLDLLAELERTLKGRRGRAYRHRFLVPGTLSIRWRIRGRLVAKATLRRSSVGFATVRVKRTKRGRRMLRRVKRSKVVARAVFAGAGHATVRARRRG